MVCWTCFSIPKPQWLVDPCITPLVGFCCRNPWIGKLQPLENSKQNNHSLKLGDHGISFLLLLLLLLLWQLVFLVRCCAVRARSETVRLLGPHEITRFKKETHVEEVHFLWSFHDHLWLCYDVLWLHRYILECIKLYSTKVQLDRDLLWKQCDKSWSLTSCRITDQLIERQLERWFKVTTFVSRFHRVNELFQTDHKQFGMTLFYLQTISKGFGEVSTSLTDSYGGFPLIFWKGLLTIFSRDSLAKMLGSVLRLVEEMFSRCSWFFNDISVRKFLTFLCWILGSFGSPRLSCRCSTKAQYASKHRAGQCKNASHRECALRWRERHQTEVPGKTWNNNMSASKLETTVIYPYIISCSPHSELAKFLEFGNKAHTNRCWFVHSAFFNRNADSNTPNLWKIHSYSEPLPDRIFSNVGWRTWYYWLKLHILYMQIICICKYNSYIPAKYFLEVTIPSNKGSVELIHTPTSPRVETPLLQLGYSPFHTVHCCLNELGVKVWVLCKAYEHTRWRIKIDLGYAFICILGTSIRCLCM